MVIGSRAFVDEVFQEFRGHFSEKRESGARTMKYGEWDGLCSMRDLGKDVVTVF